MTPVPDHNQKGIKGWVHLADPPTSELPVEDKLDQGRRIFKKGRLEFMGGPVYYEQGHDGEASGIMSGIEYMENNNRHCNYAYPMGVNNDPIGIDLGVDITEQ